MSEFDQPKKYGVAHAKQERQYVYSHLIIFTLVHILFIFLFGLVPSSELPSGSYFYHIKDWILSKDQGFFMHETANSISSVWTTILIIHVIWGLSYTIFPKKEPESNIPQHSNDHSDSNDKPISKEESSTARKKENDTPSDQKAWFYLLLSGLIEIYWAYGLKTESLSILTLIAILLSFELLIQATKTIPIGTSYAVFTGIGTIGTILVDLFIFQEPFQLSKILLIILLALFIIGLKYTGGTKKEGA